MALWDNEIQEYDLDSGAFKTRIVKVPKPKVVDWKASYFRPHPEYKSYRGPGGKLVQTNSYGVEISHAGEGFEYDEDMAQWIEAAKKDVEKVPF
jgi:hypothetical protein